MDLGASGYFCFSRTNSCVWVRVLYFPVHPLSHLFPRLVSQASRFVSRCSHFCPWMLRAQFGFDRSSARCCMLLRCSFPRSFHVSAAGRYEHRSGWAGILLTVARFFSVVFFGRVAFFFVFRVCFRLPMLVFVYQIASTHRSPSVVSRSQPIQCDGFPRDTRKKMHVQNGHRRAFRMGYTSDIRVPGKWTFVFRCCAAVQIRTT